MRLKVSINDALSKINQLIKEGGDLLTMIRGEQWDGFKDPAILNGRDLLEQKEYEQEVNLIADETFERDFEPKFTKWKEASLRALGQIYIDYVPIYSFQNASGDLRSLPQRAYNRTFLLLESNIEAKIAVLVGFYDYLLGFHKMPLFYLKDKCEIWFYDYSCNLLPNSNQSTLCGYMFDFSVGEFKEIADIYAYMTGEDVLDSHKWPKKWKTVVNTACREINRKTKKKLGFPVIKTIRETLFSINLPPKFISGTR